jgi:hypothetical protein
MLADDAIRASKGVTGLSRFREATISSRRIVLEASSFCQLRCPSCPTTAGSIYPAIGSSFLRFEDFRKFKTSIHRRSTKIRLSLIGSRPIADKMCSFGATCAAVLQLCNAWQIFLKDRLPDLWNPAEKGSLGEYRAADTR